MWNYHGNFNDVHSTPFNTLHQAHKKVLKYRDHVPVTFVPIVFGAGGVMSTLTTEHFKQWRRITPNWDHLQRLISFAFVRKRVTNFRLI
ncbi:hypothetical protein E3Q23_04404 [Wallemia mellicola]|uniref:Uncharacterized protein n=1 Tax=Wallemia mellicola TaxID=1708541 RepID=A0A4T0NDV7_9BASI|nr:hypothetical protein E3Q23_04404 [Wallemia mellicola]TIB95059.1 hypothetical protein E3Q17_04397 [Wallemia mellicola]TIC06142.1 hypothetical protein E3Q15_04458 [Wallemia mellicola]TIC06353.1 hypothetical protein E3Q14_04465 [Wallemia mellicola]TIC21295.1 hypothetical protein E3Q11_04438 [Wallemia mellicola]